MTKELSVGTRIDHDKYGEGIISKVTLTQYEVFFARGGKLEFSKANTDYKILSSPETNSATSEGLDISQVEKILYYVLDKYGALQEVIPLGEKWEGGNMILQPANTTLKGKEIPIETFFHKIVMVRDRLRVLEQNINSHPKLSDEDKINLQQYITRIYGSLTTFNVLFKEKEQYFTGASSEK